ncbi:MAG TPA: hypothetical protein VF461_14500 [Gemmatimonadaceae bacterium]
MGAAELREQLCGAIQRRSLVMFEYGDLIRVVEPHRFGVNSAGHEMLSGWLRAGYSRSDPAGGWRNYLLHEVSALQVLDAPFAGARPGYAAQDPRMPLVFCELGPAVAEMPVEGPFVVQDTPAVKPAPAPSSANENNPDVPTHSAEAARTRDVDAEPPRPAR